MCDTLLVLVSVSASVFLLSEEHVDRFFLESDTSIGSIPPVIHVDYVGYVILIIGSSAAAERPSLQSTRATI